MRLWGQKLKIDQERIPLCFKKNKQSNKDNKDCPRSHTFSPQYLEGQKPNRAGMSMTEQVPA